MRFRPLLLAFFALGFLAPALAGCLSPANVTPGATDAADAHLERTFTGVAHLAGGLPVSDAADLVPAKAVWRALGHDAIEPTVGVTSTGTLFVAAAGFVDGTPMTDVLRSRDGGVTWDTVTPQLPTGGNAPPQTGDPYVYVDPATDRVYSYDMFPALTCGYLSWSDDEGESWTQNPLGCGSPPPYDHQTLVAGPPRTLGTNGYENVVYYCVNRISDSICHRSLDGGLTWIAGAPAFLGVDASNGLPEGASFDDAWDKVCGGLHGHAVTAPDGTLYLPREYCGRPFVAVSQDDGATWTQVQVADVAASGGPDPSVAVDDAGNAYYLFVDEAGVLLLATSTDGGFTWSEPFAVAAPGVTATHLPTLAAGAEGRVAFAYAGTENLPDGYANAEYDMDEFPEDGDVQSATWNGYLGVITNALDAVRPASTTERDGSEGSVAAPVIQSTRVNALDDPLVRGYCGPGRCPGMYDFIDVVIGPDGAPFAVFTDACTGKCATPEGTAKDNTGKNMAFDGAVVTLVDGPNLRANPTG